MSTFYGYWSEPADVLRSFEEKDLPNVEILYGCYESGGYDGYATVIYRDRDDGKLYLVEGSHCSCYGLEGQWSPSETTVEALRMMPRDEERREDFAAFLNTLG